MRLASLSNLQWLAKPTALSLTSVPTMGIATSQNAKIRTRLHAEVKKADNLEVYFEKLMRRRHETKSGNIDLPRKNFE